jgi:large subunit ribosomal protein L7/L12
MAQSGKAVEELSTLTVLEPLSSAQFAERSGGDSAAAPVAALPPASGALLPAPARCRTSSPSCSPLSRQEDQRHQGGPEITGHGLKEAKDLVEAAPKAVKDGVPKADVREAQGKARGRGRKVDLK